MIQEKQILVGPKEELLERLSKLLDEKCLPGIENKSNLLLTKDGLEKQLTDISKSLTRMGKVFYLTSLKTELPAEIFELKLVLKSEYVHINLPQEFLSENILKGIK